MADRNEVLQNFMQIADCTDFGKAFEMLEGSQWNLETAIALYTSVEADVNHFAMERVSPEIQEVQPANSVRITVKNKHNGAIFEKTYIKTTKVETLRKQVCDHFRIPFEFAVWGDGIPHHIIDTDPLEELKTDRLDIEIENLMASMDRSENHALNRSITVPDSSSDEDMEIEDIIPSKMIQTRSRTIKNTGLITTQNYETIPQAVNNIKSELYNRLGFDTNLPKFVVGTLADCLSMTVNIKGDNPPWNEKISHSSVRKPTCIFVNNDGSVSNNIFVSNIMCNDLVKSQIDQCHSWCWDVTQPENRTKFLGWIDKYCDPYGEPIPGQFRNFREVRMGPRKTISELDVQKFPILLLITQDPDSKQLARIQHIITSETPIEEIVNKFVEIINTQETLTAQLVAEEFERNQREAFRMDQEQSYEKAKAKDEEDRKQKEIEKQQEIAAQQMKESEEKERENVIDRASRKVEAFDSVITY